MSRSGKTRKLAIILPFSLKDRSSFGGSGTEPLPGRVETETLQAEVREKAKMEIRRFSGTSQAINV